MRSISMYKGGKFYMVESDFYDWDDDFDKHMKKKGFSKSVMFSALDWIYSVAMYSDGSFIINGINENCSVLEVAILNSTVWIICGSDADCLELLPKWVDVTSRAFFASLFNEDTFSDIGDFISSGAEFFDKFS